MHHRKAFGRLLALATLFHAIGSSVAAEVTVSGYFNDPGNTALISSNGYNDLGAAQFGTDDNVARNVAIYRLVVPVGGGNIQFTSSGYYDGGDNGGAQPYFSIFSGSDSTATFLDSSYYDPNIDFQLPETLAAGTYLLAIGVYENLSIAENYGSPYGALSEGFTALGDPGLLGNYFYQVSVTSDDALFTVDPATPTGPTGPTGPTNVPEPNMLLLLFIGTAASVAQAWRASRVSRRASTSVEFSCSPSSSFRASKSATCCRE